MHGEHLIDVGSNSVFIVELLLLFANKPVASEQVTISLGHK